MQIKEYIVSKTENMSHITVYDFQPMETISDLNNYKDITHYSAVINEIMVDCFVNKSYQVDSQNISASITSLKQVVDAFKKENMDWLN